MKCHSFLLTDIKLMRESILWQFAHLIFSFRRSRVKDNTMYRYLLYFCKVLVLVEIKFMAFILTNSPKPR